MELAQKSHPEDKTALAINYTESAKCKQIEYGHTNNCIRANISSNFTAPVFASLLTLESTHLFPMDYNILCRYANILPTFSLPIHGLKLGLHTNAVVINICIKIKSETGDKTRTRNNKNCRRVFLCRFFLSGLK